MRLFVELDHAYVLSGGVPGLTIMDPFHRREVWKVTMDHLGLHAWTQGTEEYWDPRIIKRWWCES